jgi:DNA-binding CsgD family transcriptional regulator
MARPIDPLLPSADGLQRLLDRSGLDDPERSLLALVTHGYTNREIAINPDIDAYIVKNAVTSVNRKLAPRGGIRAQSGATHSS